MRASDGPGVVQLEIRGAGQGRRGADLKHRSPSHEPPDSIEPPDPTESLDSIEPPDCIEFPDLIESPDPVETSNSSDDSDSIATNATPRPALLIGTAGHIDHGKSSLVRALTGTDPDRLPEEKKRGISIELGFASGPLAEGVDASFIDVPGHERFVRTMVAGAHAVDVVLLAVALDEGVMPQTREHAEVCRLLGISRAVVALTRSDLAESLGPQWRELVQDDVRSLCAPFDEAECVAVSSVTGDGLSDLRAALVRTAESGRKRSSTLPALLPIDRAFSLRGHGTVLTGTLVTGTLAAGDSVELVVPAPGRVREFPKLRVRSLQTHGSRIATTGPGRRVAVNVPGLEVADVARGSVLAASGTGAIRSSALLNVELELVSQAPPLSNRTRAMIHVGTAHTLAVVDLLGGDRVSPGERMVAQIRLDRAVSALRGQHFILRGFQTIPGGGKTLGGGRILSLDHRRRRPRDRPFVEALAKDEMSALAALVRDAGGNGLARAPTFLRLGIEGAGEFQDGSGNVSDGGVRSAKAGDAETPFVLPPDITQLGDRLFDSHLLSNAIEPLRQLIRDSSGLTPEEARVSLGQTFHPLAFAWVTGQLGDGFSIGDIIRVDEKKPPDPLAETIAPVFARSGLEPPTIDGLVRLTQAAKKEVLISVRRLAEEGRVVRLTRELYVDVNAAERFKEQVLAAFSEKDSLSTGELKDIAGTSRKFAIPLCEWLDSERLTVRVGDERVLRGRG